MKVHSMVERLREAEKTAESRAQRELAVRTRQQEAIATLGLRALQLDLDQLMVAAVEAVSDTLEVPFAKILQLLPSGEELLLKAGVGWQAGLVGEATVGTGEDSQAGYTLRSEHPVIVEDLSTETRFWGPDLLIKHQVVSGLSVVIGRRTTPWGVFGAHDRTLRMFTPHDVNFLQAVANVVSAAIEREEIEEELRVSRERLALQQAQDKLRRAERLASLGTLAAGIAHEINNPLNSIVMTAERAGLRRVGSGTDGGALAGDLDRIIGEAERCGKIVRSVLRFARDEQADREAADLNEIVREAAALATNYAKGQRSDIVLNPLDELARVRMSPAEMVQVFLNLMQNAIESREEGAGVRVTIERQGDQVVVSVEDDGHGIDPGVLPHIFDPFYSTRRERGGTGLGLSLANTIVQEHGGEIDVNSEPGVGSRFRVKLPLDRTA